MPFIKAPRLEDCRFAQDIIGLDCEMCYTKAGMEVIKICVVSIISLLFLDSDWQTDGKGEKLMEELCRTTFPVLDLNTRYSGVASLDDAKHDFTSLREELFKYMHRDTILIGHGYVISSWTI